MKDGLWVNYHLADGRKSSYAASLLGNLKHWLIDYPEIKTIQEKLWDIRREEICKKQ